MYGNCVSIGFVLMGEGFSFGGVSDILYIAFKRVLKMTMTVMNVSSLSSIKRLKVLSNTMAILISPIFNSLFVLIDLISHKSVGFVNQMLLFSHILCLKLKNPQIWLVVETSIENTQCRYRIKPAWYLERIWITRGVFCHLR